MQRLDGFWNRAVADRSKLFSLLSIHHELGAPKNIKELGRNRLVFKLCNGFLADSSFLIAMKMKGEPYALRS